MKLRGRSVRTENPCIFNAGWFSSDKDEITTKIGTVLKVVRKSLKKQQDDLSQLLGRLEDKYDVTDISNPTKIFSILCNI